MLRNPVASGKFYPATPTAIKEQINSFLSDSKCQKSKAIGAILPHAGYVYSGEVAVSVVAQLEIPRTLILLGPNHTGIGPALSIMDKGAWKTPLGNVAINDEVAEVLKDSCGILSSDTSAHMYEHCLEVQLPILQYFNPNFNIVPIVLGPISLKDISELGGAIAKTIKQIEIEENTLIIASTDMTHYESQDNALAKDKLAIAEILKLQFRKLIEVVGKNDISMCGLYPTAVVIEAAQSLGARQAKLIKYETSAKASADYSSVVGYAGIIIK